VAGSAAALVATGVVFGFLWISSLKTRSFSAQLPGSVLGIELRVQSGNVDVVGGSRNGLSISHSDRSAFGHGPRSQRSIRNGIVTITSSCPQLVVGHCGSDYRITVPANIPISIRAEHGTVYLAGYHGSADIATDTGAITAEGYCGFVLGAASAAAMSACRRRALLSVWHCAAAQATSRRSCRRATTECRPPRAAAPRASGESPTTRALRGRSTRSRAAGASGSQPGHDHGCSERACRGTQAVQRRVPRLAVRISECSAGRRLPGCPAGRAARGGRHRPRAVRTRAQARQSAASRPCSCSWADRPRKSARTTSDRVHRGSSR
jgi:hypothetical protein